MIALFYLNTENDWFRLKRIADQKSCRRSLDCLHILNQAAGKPWPLNASVSAKCDTVSKALETLTLWKVFSFDLDSGTRVCKRFWFLAMPSPGRNAICLTSWISNFEPIELTNRDWFKISWMSVGLVQNQLDVWHHPTTGKSFSCNRKVV